MASDPREARLRTRAQIEAIPLGGRPLVVCDVDEVALEFVIHLENHLLRKGFRLLPRSYGLTGNIVLDGTETPATQDDVRRLLHSFFAEDTHLQTPVAGAAESLSILSEWADIVMLTNMPDAQREIRSDTLARHGMAYPVVTNTGPKGEAVRHLADRAGGPVIFLDDSPSNVGSVRKAVDEAFLVQFIGDPRFLAMATPVEGIHMLTGDWREALTLALGVLGGADPERLPPGTVAGRESESGTR